MIFDVSRFESFHRLSSRQNVWTRDRLLFSFSPRGDLARVSENDRNSVKGTGLFFLLIKGQNLVHGFNKNLNEGSRQAKSKKGYLHTSPVGLEVAVLVLTLN